jgi:uncharacterized membrane protein YfhO
MDVSDSVEKIKPLELVHWSSERIEIQALGPGILVLSEVYYPGWQVWVDGERTEIEVAKDILRAVRVESGSHRVVFIFRPWSVYLGLFLFTVPVGFLIIRLFIRRRKR